MLNIIMICQDSSKTSTMIIIKNVVGTVGIVDSCLDSDYTKIYFLLLSHRKQAFLSSLVKQITINQSKTQRYYFLVGTFTFLPNVSLFALASYYFPSSSLPPLPVFFLLPFFYVTCFFYPLFCLLFFFPLSFIFYSQCFSLAFAESCLYLIFS